jgi:hypothetical protein
MKEVRMRRSITIIALALWPIAALAQPPSKPVAPETVGLARIDASLREILSLLRRQTEVQATELLMKRVELAEARLGESNNRLRVVTAERRALEAAKISLTARIEILAAKTPDVSTGESPQLEAAARQAIGEERRIQRRLEALAGEIGTLENEISSQSAELASWQDMLDRQLARH